MASNTHLQRTAWAMSDPLLTEYYDTEWGDIVTTEPALFERLTLEAFQSGLSWLTILKKREGFRRAFAEFDVDRVAEYDEGTVEELLLNAEIIRNRRKIEATLTNARAIRTLRDEDEYGFAGLVWSFLPEHSPVFQQGEAPPSTSPESVALAKALKKRGFQMVGPTTMYALMGAIGMVDQHAVESFRRGCSGLWNRDGTRTAKVAPFSAD